MLQDHCFKGFEGRRQVPTYRMMVSDSLKSSLICKQDSLAFLGVTAYLPVFPGSQALWKVGVSPSVLFFLIASEDSALGWAPWYAEPSGWISFFAKTYVKLGSFTVGYLQEYSFLEHYNYTYLIIYSIHHERVLAMSQVLRIMK